MMKHWHAKELSQLTHVSVRTLHHYDKVGLLKPTYRQSNGYRLYSEQDLLKLQQIIALKFFGFELAQIKLLLAKQDSIVEKAETLLEASTILTRITHDCSNEKSIPWQQIMQLIEVYNMTQQLEDSWVKDIFTPEELKQYAAFQTELKSRATPEKIAAFEKSWFTLVEKVKSNLTKDPASAIGIQLGEECMQWVNNVYGKKYANLRTKKFEKGFAEGKGLDEVGLTPEMVLWLDKAADAYWRQRISSILAKVGKASSSEVLQLWNDVLDDMYGDESERKKAVLTAALHDDNVSEAAKIWLRSLAKS